MEHLTGFLAVLFKLWAAVFLLFFEIHLTIYLLHMCVDRQMIRPMNDEMKRCLRNDRSLYEETNLTFVWRKTVNEVGNRSPGYNSNRELPGAVQGVKPPGLRCSVPCYDGQNPLINFFWGVFYNAVSISAYVEWQDGWRIMSWKWFVWKRLCSNGGTILSTKPTSRLHRRPSGTLPTSRKYVTTTRSKAWLLHTRNNIP
jgi:hypothetical protein